MPLPTAPSSFWLDRRSPLDGRPALEGSRDADVAVVGAGIVGACLARCLLREGLRVVLLDADVAGRGATGRNAGFLLAEGSETAAEVSREHGAATAQALRAAGLRTREALPWLSGARDFGFRRTGSLRLAEDAAEAADFAETARLLSKDVRFLPEADLPRAYRGRGFAAGLVDAGDGVVSPLRLLDGILVTAHAEAQENGGALAAFDGSPVLAVDESGPDVVVRTPRGSVRAARAVVTTNAWINRLLPDGPFVRPVRAQMLAAHVTPVPAWEMPVYSGRGADYWRLVDGETVLLGGRRLVGGSSEETDDASPAAPVQPALDALLFRLAGEGAQADVKARWAGTMGFTADGIPVAGRAPGHERVWVLGGCNGHGMGWGPGLASMLAEAMAGRGEGPGACFDPARAAVTRGS